MLCISNFIFCQTDTIYKVNGEALYVNVAEITESSVKYVYPEEDFQNTVNKKSIAKIHFKSGRKQEFTSPLNLAKVKSCLDWKSVQVSSIDAEVSGLYRLDNVGSKAKGITTLSSISKLQDRAYNKLKIATAMLGGNVVYLMSQNTEESIFGGEESSTKLPSVTISGIAYSSRKIQESEINFGGYAVSHVFALRTNEVDIRHLNVQSQYVSINKEDIKNNNNSLNLKLKIFTLHKVKEYKVIYASSTEIVLSAVHSTRRGKKTFYNVVLKRS